MSDVRRDLLRRRFDPTWALFEYHLERLEDEDFLWEPAPLCRTLRPGPDGTWHPDWADTGPDPARPYGRGVAGSRQARDRGAARPAYAWLAALDRLTDTAALDATAPFPRPNDPSYTVADMLARVNAELMKNVAEIGQARSLRRALT